MNSILQRLGVTPETVGEMLWSILPPIVAISVFVVFWLIFYLITARLLKEMLSRTPIRAAMVEILVVSIYKWFTFILVLVTALSQVGFDVTTAVAGLGIAGIALGFAARETLANILAGFSILIDDLYRRGHWIEIGGKFGEVRKISLRMTKIRTLDNIFISIPNSEVTVHPVSNYSEEGMIRFSIKILVGFHESIGHIRNTLLSKIAQMEEILQDPEPEVVAEQFEDSGVTLMIRVWIADAGKEPKTRFKLTEVCKEALNEAGIEVQLPQRVIHMK